LAAVAVGRLLKDGGGGGDGQAAAPAAAGVAAAVGACCDQGVPLVAVASLRWTHARGVVLNAQRLSCATKLCTSRG
jgi:hypothetical protein